MNIQIPKWPIADEKEIQSLTKVLASNQWWRNYGEEVKQFEQEFSNYLCCNGAVSVANGTIAIEIALKALNIGVGDEVIVPDFTFYSTVSAIWAVGAKAVFVDICQKNYCIDPTLIEEAINCNTKAIIVVHMAGHTCDMDAINDIAQKNKLYVIEDSAHAHGAEYKGKKAGTLSTCGTFSFQNAKLMTSGEGGIITTNDKELLQKIFLESNCGRAENDTNYQHVLIGTNARLSEFQGAILRIQLTRLNEQLNIRKQNYQYFSQLLKTLPGISLQHIENYVTTNSHYMLMFEYDSKHFNNKTRQNFIDYLKSYGIPCNRAFEALHRLPISISNNHLWRYGNISKKCPISQYIADNVVCINHNVLLAEKSELNKLFEIINNFSHIN